MRYILRTHKLFTAQCAVIQAVIRRKESDKVRVPSRAAPRSSHSARLSVGTDHL